MLTLVYNKIEKFLGAPFKKMKEKNILRANQTKQAMEPEKNHSMPQGETDLHERFMKDALAMVGRQQTFLFIVVSHSFSLSKAPVTSAPELKY